MKEKIERHSREENISFICCLLVRPAFTSESGVSARARLSASEQSSPSPLDVNSFLCIFPSVDM